MELAVPDRRALLRWLSCWIIGGASLTVLLSFFTPELPSPSPLMMIGGFVAGLWLYATYAPAPIIVTALLIHRSAGDRALGARHPLGVAILGAVGGATWPIVELARGVIEVSSPGWHPGRAYGIGVSLGAASVLFAWWRARTELAAVSAQATRAAT